MQADYFRDKTGEPIQPGDIVQIRVGDEPVMFVIQAKDDVLGIYSTGTLANPEATGVKLTDEIAAQLLVVEHQADDSLD